MRSRIWTDVTVWNGGTGLVRVTSAAWQMIRYGGGFVTLPDTGLVACHITGMALVSRTYARITKGATR